MDISSAAINLNAIHCYNNKHNVIIMKCRPTLDYETIQMQQ